MEVGRVDILERFLRGVHFEDEIGVLKGTESNLMRRHCRTGGERRLTICYIIN